MGVKDGEEPLVTLRRWDGDSLSCSPTTFYFRDLNVASPYIVCYTAVFNVVTQRSSLWRGALRDDTKNGCVDYALPYCTCSCQRNKGQKSDRFRLAKSRSFGHSFAVVARPRREHVRELSETTPTQRQRKRHLTIEFVPFQTLSSLFHLVQFVKRWQIFEELNSKGLYRSSGKEKEIRYLVFTPSTKRFTS